jgi:AcrR family transcriptional regulator
VYHHFRSREELLNAVVESVFSQLRTIIETAEAQRSRNARAEYMLNGYAELTVRNRALMAVLAGDPGVIDMLRAERGDLIDRQIKLLADLDPGPAGLVKAAVVLAGIAGATQPALIDLDDDDLRRHLVDVGRRALGLRAPARQATR